MWKDLDKRSRKGNLNKFRKVTMKKEQNIMIKSQKGQQTI